MMRGCRLHAGLAPWGGMHGSPPTAVLRCPLRQRCGDGGKAAAITCPVWMHVPGIATALPPWRACGRAATAALAVLLPACQRHQRLCCRCLAPLAPRACGIARCSAARSQHDVRDAACGRWLVCVGRLWSHHNLRGPPAAHTSARMSPSPRHTRPTLGVQVATVGTPRCYDGRESSSRTMRRRCLLSDHVHLLRCCTP